MSVKIWLLKHLDGSIGRLLANLVPAAKGAPSGEVSPTRVLFVRPGGIGDAVLLVPAILAVKRHFPEATIHLLAERRNAQVFALCPAVSATFRYDVPRELAVLLGNHYDLAIDTEQWHRLSAIVTRSTRAAVTIGFNTNERGRLFTHPIGYSQEDYERESFLRLLAPLGISPGGGGEGRFLAVPPLAEAEARRLLGPLSSRPYVVIFPGASIPERRWGVERFQEVAGRLTRKGVAVVVVGAREDVADAEGIVADNDGLNLAGRTSLGTTAAVIGGARLLVSGDSGILHLGVGLNVPTVSLFGPGIAAKWAPPGERHIVLNKGLDCSPCTRFGTTPPCPRNGACLAAITADEVAEAAFSLLARNGANKFS